MVNNMSSRMDKYENSTQKNLSRVKRNYGIYNSGDMSELTKIKTNTNVSIISEASKEINIEKIKKYLNSINDDNEEKRKRISLELPKEEEEEIIEREEIKTYDINSVLEQAREKKEINYEEDRHRKLNETGYDILKSLKIKEKENENEEILDDEQLNTQEKTIVNLIQDIQNGSNESKKSKEFVGETQIEDDDLFKELMSEHENTIVMAPIDEIGESEENIKDALETMTRELEELRKPLDDKTQDLILEKERIKERLSNNKKIEDEKKKKNSNVDKSFYTNSISFNKTDFEGFDDLEKNDKKANLLAKIGIFIIVLILLGTFVIILSTIFEWNIL